MGDYIDFRKCKKLTYTSDMCECTKNTDGDYLVRDPKYNPRIEVNLKNLINDYLFVTTDIQGKTLKFRLALGPKKSDGTRSLLLKEEDDD